MNNFLAPLMRLYIKKGPHLGNTYRKKGMRPGTDWKVIIYTLFFIGVCTGIAHVFVYNGVKNNLWWTVDNTNTVYQVKINRPLLDGVLERLEKNNARVEEIKINPVSVKDPSR